MINLYSGLLYAVMMLVFCVPIFLSVDRGNKKVERIKTVIISVLVVVYLAVYLCFYYFALETIKTAVS